jgi:hypothetical protein
MNRFQNYSQAKTLADDLNISRSTIKNSWTNNKTNVFWEAKVKTLRKEILKRNKLFDKAQALSTELRIPLTTLNSIGTTHKFWKNTLQRMRMARVRALRRGQAATRTRMTRITTQVRQAPVRRRARAFLPQLRQATATRQRQQRINNRIRTNQFQLILDGVLNGDTLTVGQIQRLWNKIATRGRYSLKVGFNDGVEQFIAFNNNSRRFIDHILTNGLVFNNNPTFGSDTIDNFDLQHINKLELELYNPPNVISNADGSFFPYINTCDIELSEYQIFTQKEAYDEEERKTREQCLIHTLLQAGVKRALVNQIKMTYVKGAAISKKDLHNIANIINRNINVFTWKGKIQKQKIKSNDPKFEDIDIALYENHYFLYEPTKYSSYCILHYEEVKDIKDFYNIVKIKKDKKKKTRFIRKDQSKINTLQLVHKLHEANYFKKLDMKMFEESASHIDLRNHIYLENIEDEQQEVSTGKKLVNVSPKENEEEIEEEEDPQERRVFYADCETFVKGDKHELYLLGVVGSKDDIVDIYNVCDQEEKDEVSKEQRVVYKFLNRITNNKKFPALVYFHNLKYDYNILEKYITIKKRCEKDGQLYNIICKFGGVEVEFRDSYKIIPFALSKFGKEFDLPKEIRKKEAISYEYYTRENNDKRIETDEYKKSLSKKDRLIFEEVIRPSKTNENYCDYDSCDKTFNPLEYYKEYLRLDCLVLKKGIEKFNELIFDITDGMSIYDSLTISSLTDKYMKVEGAYEGVFEMRGNLREYVAQAVYGGRVCVNPTYLKKVIKGKISDYDGVSLYPSAINRLCRLLGLPTGKAKRFIQPNMPDWGDCEPDFNDFENLTETQTGNLDTWEDKIYSILTVKITAVNKIQQMPFIAHKTKDSIKYTNEAPTEPIIIDSITLQDYINFHEIEYEILDGVYWDEGTNKTMGEVIKKLFNARLEAKKQNKKALSNTIKLMLNSSYGKTIMKKSKCMKKIVNISAKSWNKKTGKWSIVKKTKWENFVYRNFNTIKSWRKLNDTSYEVEMICADDSFNRGHIGCAILSTSKRIMNEVFDVANDNKYPIYYTDTDSLHCNYEDVIKLETKYEERYNRVLNGQDLEQFHTDFDLEGACDEIYATKSIFLGKKSYIDHLESKDKDGNTINGYHIRLKGITTEGLEHTAKTYSEDKETPEYFKLYEDLAKGTPKKITLNPFNKEANSKKVLFEFGNGNVSTRKEFIREVKF